MVNADPLYKPLMDSIIAAMPDVDIRHFEPGVRSDVREGSMHLEFREAKRLSPAALVALLAGRTVVSNVQEPYCGYINIEQDMDEFKKEVIQAIRLLKKTPTLNLEARDYYRAQTDAAAFKAAVEKIVVGEAVNAA
jgi:hypothetical protein